MTWETAEKTLAMKTWAVVGASDDPSRVSYDIVARLRERGYEVLPVNPRLESVQGMRCWPSIAALPHKPEVVDMVVNPAVGIGVMREIADAGIGYVWLQPGTVSGEIVAFARDHGIEVIEGCVLVALARTA